MDHLKIKRVDVDTECIIRHGYDQEYKILELEFCSGNNYVYRYYNVPEEVATKLLEVKNGYFFNKYVRNEYDFKRYGGPTSLDIKTAICYNELRLF